MNSNLISLLQGSENYNTWLAISENRVADALQILAGDKTEKRTGFWGLGKKKVVTPTLDSVQQIAWELLSGKPAPILVAPTSTLKDAGEHFPEWIRLMIVLHYNGHYHQESENLLQETLKWLGNLAEEVCEKAGNYPNVTIPGYVWMNGSIIRKWCDPLAECFDQSGSLTNKANALQFKCKITSSIMSHYPQTLGPDMIAAAGALETVGETAIAKSYYNAIIADFQPMADDILAASEEPVTEDDLLILQALRDAYTRLGQGR